MKSLQEIIRNNHDFSFKADHSTNHHHADWNSANQGAARHARRTIKKGEPR